MNEMYRKHCLQFWKPKEPDYVRGRRMAETAAVGKNVIELVALYSDALAHSQEDVYDKAYQERLRELMNGYPPEEPDVSDIDIATLPIAGVLPGAYDFVQPLKSIQEVFEEVCCKYGFAKPFKKANALYWMNEAVATLHTLGYLKPSGQEISLEQTHQTVTSLLKQNNDLALRLHQTVEQRDAYAVALNSIDDQIEYRTFGKVDFASICSLPNTKLKAIAKKYENKGKTDEPVADRSVQEAGALRNPGVGGEGHSEKGSADPSRR